MVLFVRSRNACMLPATSAFSNMPLRLFAERLHLGAHLGDGGFTFSGLGSIAIAGRLLVALHADAIEHRQRQLRVGLPGLGT